MNLTPHLLRRHLLFLISLLFLSAGAQKRLSNYEVYIERYKHLALSQMYKYGIPASITMAQGLLESGAGTSRLAVKGNNHFGIKAHNWSGPCMLVNDDAPNEKFRVYRSVEASYEDHSLFLSRNRRYAGLFRLQRDDYKGWAHGLKAAGYATNPRYAQQLIGVIETYRLYNLDRIRHKDFLHGKYETDKPATGQVSTVSRGVYRCNGAYYVLAETGDTYKTISKWSGVSERKLRKYNEVPKHARLEAGQVVYLEKKRSKADRKLKGYVHYVKEGETYHSIAQRYGIRLKTLYKNNKLPEYASISVGQALRIR